MIECYRNVITVIFYEPWRHDPKHGFLRALGISDIFTVSYELFQRVYTFLTVLLLFNYI